MLTRLQVPLRRLSLHLIDGLAHPIRYGAVDRIFLLRSVDGDDHQAVCMFNQDFRSVHVCANVSSSEGRCGSVPVSEPLDQVVPLLAARSNIYILSFQLGKAATNSSLKPSSLSTSAVCSPNLGGGRRTAEGVRE